ncbi:thioredoxin-domain-containing protein [Meredithblackwellia eburnea MCA 4105]
MSLIQHINSQGELDSLIAARKDKLIVIDFHATWCGPCHAIAPKYEQLSTAYKSFATFCKVDVDKNQETSKKYGIRAMPTFIFLKNGTVLGEVKGANAPAIEAAIKKYSGASPEGGAIFPGAGQTLSGTEPKAVGETDNNFKVLLSFVLFGAIWWWLSKKYADPSIVA